MPVSTLVATAGAANANAYVTVAVADQYHLDRPAVGTTWSAATNDQKTAAILWATKLLDRLYIWNGTVVDSVQNLLWPRAGLAEVNNWNPLSLTEIPDHIQWATAEFARQLLVADRMGDNQVLTQGLSSLRVGNIRLGFKDEFQTQAVPDAVAALIPLEWGELRASGERELVRA